MEEVDAGVIESRIDWGDLSFPQTAQKLGRPAQCLVG
jgi:hypothetical protein